MIEAPPLDSHNHIFSTVQDLLQYSPNGALDGTKLIVLLQSILKDLGKISNFAAAVGMNPAVTSELDNLNKKVSRSVFTQSQRSAKLLALHNGSLRRKWIFESWRRLFLTKKLNKSRERIGHALTPYVQKNHIRFRFRVWEYYAAHKRNQRRWQTGKKLFEHTVLGVRMSFFRRWLEFVRKVAPAKKKLIRDAIVDKLMVGTKYRTQRMAYVNWLHYLLMMKDRRRRQRLANSLIVSSVFLKRQWAYRKWQEYLALRRKRKALSKAMSAMLSITDNGIRRKAFFKLAHFRVQQLRTRAKKAAALVALKTTPQGVRRCYFAKWALYRSIRKNKRLIMSSVTKMLGTTVSGLRRRAYFAFAQFRTEKMLRRRRRALGEIILKNTKRGTASLAFALWRQFHLMRMKRYRNRVLSSAVLNARPNGLLRQYYLKWSTFTHEQKTFNRKRRVATTILRQSTGSLRRLYYFAWQRWSTRVQHKQRVRKNAFHVLAINTPFVVLRRYFAKFALYRTQRKLWRRKVALKDFLGSSIQSAQQRRTLYRWIAWMKQVKIYRSRHSLQHIFVTKGMVSRIRKFWKLWDQYVLNRRAAQFNLIREVLQQQPTYSLVLERLLGRLQRVDRDLLLLAHEKASKKECVTVPDVLRLNVLVQEGNGMTVRVNRVDEQSAIFQLGRTMQLAADMSEIKNFFASQDVLAENFLAEQREKRAYIESQERVSRDMLTERSHFIRNKVSESSAVHPSGAKTPVAKKRPVSETPGVSSTIGQSPSPVTTVVQKGHEASAQRWRARSAGLRSFY